jgi:hypothetical protein
MHVPSEESERSYIYVLEVIYICVRGHIYMVLEVLVLPLSMIFPLDFRTFDNVVFFVFQLRVPDIVLYKQHMSSRLCGIFLYINIIIS